MDLDFLELLDAERTQLQAEDAVAESEKDEYVAVIAVYKALGGIPKSGQPVNDDALRRYRTCSSASG